MQGNGLERVGRFKYLGSTVSEDVNLDTEISSRVEAQWSNWRKISGVLYDKG